MIRPHRFEYDFAAHFDDINHVGERSVRNVDRAIEIVYEHSGSDSILVSALLGVFEFLFPSLVRNVMLSWMWLADIDGQKLEGRVAIIPVKFVEGRNLAHERGSRDTAEFEEHMLSATKCGKANPVTIETG